MDALDKDFALCCSDHNVPLVVVPLMILCWMVSIMVGWMLHYTKKSMTTHVSKNDWAQFMYNEKPFAKFTMSRDSCHPKLASSKLTLPNLFGSNHVQIYTYTCQFCATLNYNFSRSEGNTKYGRCLVGGDGCWKSVLVTANLVPQSPPPNVY